MNRPALLEKFEPEKTLVTLIRRFMVSRPDFTDEELEEVLSPWIAEAVVRAGIDEMHQIEASTAQAVSWRARALHQKIMSCEIAKTMVLRKYGIEL